MPLATLVSIDAWHDGEGWYWNDQFKLRDLSGSECPNFDDSRKLLRWLRAEGYLTPESAGHLAIEWAHGDPDIVEIQLRGTHQPILAFVVSWEDG